jgi:hypothetical protein
MLLSTRTLLVRKMMHVTANELTELSAAIWTN